MDKRALMAAALLAMLATACKKEEAVPTTDAAPQDAAPVSPARPAPSFGGVTEVVIQADGVAETPELAALKAIDSAVAQVNGRRVASVITSIESGLRIESLGGSESVRSDAFAQAVVSASQGVVTSFRILSQEEIQRVEAERIIKAEAEDAGYSVDASSEHSFDGEASSSASASASALSRGGYAGADASVSERARVSASGSDSLSVERGASRSSFESSERQFDHYWKVRIEAKVAKYEAPEEKGRPKLAIVMPRVDVETFAVGDQRIPAADIAGEIRDRLSDVLTQTKRFIILDREFGDVLGEEAAFIQSGNARPKELARIGQQMATDLLLVVSVDRFDYPRTTRNLRMSDRQLISYAGGGRVSLKLINATTGEVVMSESFEHELPPTAPSTMPRVIDGRALAGDMMDAIAGRMSFSVVNEIFPISVVALQGTTVVLSQGGQSVAEGQRYEAVVLGQELVDPQTGNSLGRMESPCCVIRIDRVSEQTSYGTIEGAMPALPGTFTPGMIELREPIGAEGAVEASAAATSAPASAPAPRATARPEAAPAAKPVAEDDADW